MLVKEFKYWFYLASWMVKIIMILYTQYLNSRNRISAKVIDTFQMLKRVHFITFNIVVIDAAFIGTRTLLHSHLIRAIFYKVFMSIMVLFLCLVDIMEIIWVTYKVVYLEEDQMISKKDFEK